MTEHSSRFLIVRLGSLGDIIHAIPAAAALRARYPGARIDWLVDPRYTPVVQLVEGLDEAIPISPRGDAGTLLRTIRQLRRTRYDAAVDLQGLLKSAVLTRAAGARRVDRASARASARADGAHLLRRDSRSRARSRTSFARA